MRTASLRQRHRRPIDAAVLLEEVDLIRCRVQRVSDEDGAREWTQTLRSLKAVSRPRVDLSLWPNCSCITADASLRHRTFYELPLRKYLDSKPDT